MIDTSRTPRTNAMADRFGDIDPDSPYWEALELATKLELELRDAYKAFQELPSEKPSERRDANAPVSHRRADDPKSQFRTHQRQKKTDD